MENYNILRIPLCKLHYIEDVNSFKGLSEIELKSLKNEYSNNEVSKIIEAVKWAIDNPDFDFLSLALPPKLQHSNEEVYKYLCILADSLKLI